MSNKMQSVMTALGFVILFAMFAATYSVTSGNVTKFAAQKAPVTTASTAPTPAI